MATQQVEATKKARDESYELASKQAVLCIEAVMGNVQPMIDSAAQTILSRIDLVNKGSVNFIN